MRLVLFFIKSEDAKSARHLEMKIISILNIVRFCGSVNCIFESRLS